MKNKVYFVSLKNNEDKDALKRGLERLLQASGVLGFVRKSDRVAVKVHFGEAGNTGFVGPENVRMVVEAVLRTGGKPFVSDTNTLYKGRRTNTGDHLELAREHGFTKESLGAEIIIPDDTDKKATAEIHLNRKYVKTAKIGRIFAEADAIVAVSHFKGHMLSGFGGAIKNLAMGCAMREGKLMQHCDVTPVFYREHCTGCGECERVCPSGAIEIKDGKSSIDPAKCIGCANCVGVCSTMALFVDMKAGDKMQMKMAEYAEAVLKNKKGKAGFVSFAVKINKECDCWGGENPRIAPDVGIFASNDPVSIDKACFDLVNDTCRKDIFKETHPDQDGLKQLVYAQELGLGNLEYELIRL